MDVVSVINYKGGVGKTTTTANLAAELARRGKRVLLLDLDAQASLTFSFIRPDTWKEQYADSKTIKAWFDSFSTGTPIQLKDLICAPNVDWQLEGTLHLIPSHLGLINVDLEMATELGGANLRQAKKNFLKVHKRLQEGLRTLNQGDYDLVLVDCPPNFNIATKTAIVASNKILIPAKPDYLSTLGIDYLKRNLNQLVSDFNEYATLDDEDSIERISPSVLGVVFTMVQITSGQPIAAQRQYIAQTKRLGIPVFEGWIRENKTLFSNAPEYGVPVVLQTASGDTYRNVINELKTFVDEFESTCLISDILDG